MGAAGLSTGGPSAGARPLRRPFPPSRATSTGTTSTSSTTSSFQAAPASRRRERVRLRSLVFEGRDWGVDRQVVSARASYTHAADAWQSSSYNEKCSLLMAEMVEAAELRQWDRVRGLLVKAAKDIDSYLDEDPIAVGSDVSFKTYASQGRSKLEDLLRDVEAIPALPKPLLVMFARRLVVGGSCSSDAHLMHCLQILRWLRASTIQRQAEMVATAKDYTRIVNALLKKSKTLKARDVNPYEQRAYECWRDMRKVCGVAKLDGAAVRAGMNACATARRTVEALEVFEGASSASSSAAGIAGSDATVCYNILIKGFGLEGDLEGLEAVLSRMEAGAVRKTESTYNTLVNAFVSLDRVDRAWQAMQEALASGSAGEESKQYMYATVLKGIVRRMNPNLKGMTQALDLMNRMKALGVVPDVYVYSQLIDHLIKKRNDVDAADRLFQQMQRQEFGAVEPNVVVYNMLLRGLCNQNSGLSKNGAGWSKVRCLELLKDMGSRGIKPNTSTFNTLISAAVSNDDQRSANKLFKLMVDLKVDPDRMTFTTIMKSFSDQRRPEECARIFEELDAWAFGGADKIAFNCLLGAHGKAGDLQQAEEVYNRMLKRGIQPDSVTFNSMVRACCALKDPRRAALFVSRACGRGIRIAPSLYDVTIKMCVAAEEFADCKSMLRSMRQLGVEGTDLAEQFVEERRVASTKKGQNLAVERVKFWVGLPNSYYNTDEDWR